MINHVRILSVFLTWQKMRLIIRTLSVLLLGEVVSATVLKDARMELKTTNSKKEMLKTAAALAGQDLTSFILASAEERAKSVLTDYQSLSLSLDDQARLMDALANPAKPTRALKELMSLESLVER